MEAVDYDMADSIRKDYFPFTDKCTQDGQPCLGKKCMMLMNEKICWYYEFDKMVAGIFKGDPLSYYYYRSPDGEAQVSLHVRLSISEREEFNQPPTLYITIGLESLRLAKIIKEKFNLTDWEIECFNYDGGDDHNLEKSMEAPHSKKSELIKILEEVRDLLPQIIEVEKDVNTCQLCKNHSTSLYDIQEHSICYQCKEKIVREKIHHYFRS